MRPTNLIFTSPNVDPGPKYRKVIAIAKQVGGEFKTVTHTGKTALAVCDKTFEAYLSTLPKPAVVETEPVASETVAEVVSEPVAEVTASETVAEPEAKPKTQGKKKSAGKKKNSGGA